MRNILLASAALVAMIGHAEAQDAGYNWSGFYVGAQAGYGWSRVDFSGTNIVPAGDHQEDGFVAGVYVGHDWQAGNYVFGALADLDYIDTDTLGLEGTFDGKSEAYTYDVDWLATARVRAGFLPTDRLLVYGTGGLAVTQFKTSGFNSIFSTSGSNSSNVEFGGVIGAGVEFAASKNWSIKAEYLRYDFNSPPSIEVGPSSNPDFDPSFDTVKVGVSYRFGS